MLHTITNGILTVTVAERGCELQSITANGNEYMHDGSPRFWPKKAPIMFPICGRFFDGKYIYRGKEYEMNTHGFARNMDFSLTENSGSQMSFVLESNAQTKESYPFDFIFTVTYVLDKNRLNVIYNVTNTDSKDIYFALGGHPAFVLPLGNEGKFEDCLLEFSEPCQAKRVDFSPTSFRTGNDSLYCGELKKIALDHSLFDSSAIFLYDTSKSVTLRSSKSARSIRIDFEDFKYIGFWHIAKTQANYLCIEPWTSLPSYDGKIEDIEQKEDMQILSPNQSFEIGYSISVE